jgi:hypothetical protein
MKTKSRFIKLVLPGLLLGTCSAAVLAADDPAKPAADPGTMSQPDKNTQDSSTKPDTNTANQPGQTGTADVTAQMKKLDTDKDGTVSKAEAQKMRGLADGFDQADADKDGKLNAAELSQALSKMPK